MGEQIGLGPNFKMRLSDEDQIVPDQRNPPRITQKYFPLPPYGFLSKLSIKCYWEKESCNILLIPHSVPVKDKIGRDQGNPLGITQRPQSHTSYVAALFCLKVSKEKRKTIWIIEEYLDH